ncbi:hypothetical protein [Myroides fluvii]|uniref:hypothetical protein n=1 Tax=Myroides fluvii TaxID=2572594 RepID=UPI00131DF34D|nr:hypothetical protein [Myroides fluvii]
MKKIYTLALSLITLMTFTKMRGQKMGDLYTYIINDCYEVSLKEGFISKQDTLYFTCGFCDCNNKCFDYEIELVNDKIQFNLPIVNNIHSKSIFYRLSSPEIDRQYLVFYVGIYDMVFYDDNNKEFVYNGTIKYVFKYNSKMSKFVFESKMEYGL